MKDQKKNKGEKEDYSDSTLYRETDHVEIDTKMKIPTEESVEDLKKDVDNRHL